MNVRIFWVHAMKCMCAQTRPRFILSSEGVLGGMEFEPMLPPREKSPLPENVPSGGSNPRRCGQRAQALPTELFQPPNMMWTVLGTPLLMVENKREARHYCFGQYQMDEPYPKKYKGITFFPKPKRRLEDCKAWIRVCGQPHDQTLHLHTWSVFAKLRVQS